MTDLHAMTLNSERRRQGSPFIMQAVMTYGLLVSTIIVLTGLPSIVRLDAILAPATWVIWCLQIHVVAGSALIVLWLVNAYSLIVTGLIKSEPKKRSHFSS